MVRYLLLIVCIGTLVACGGAVTPQLIGSYPDSGSPPLTDWSPTNGSPPPQNLYIAYNAALDMEVDHPNYAVYSVRAIAEHSGGYLLNSRTWSEGGDEYAEATVAVPVGNFESVKAQIRSLGTVRAESVSGEIRNGSPTYLDGAASFSNITVSLKPNAANWLMKIGGFVGGVIVGLFWLFVWIMPPFLMLVGLITSIRTVVGWLRKRAQP